MQWYNPDVLWFLLLLPLLALLCWRAQRRAPALKFSDVSAFLKARKQSLSERIVPILPLLMRALVIVACVLAVARPGDDRGRHKDLSEGLDIMLVLDTSGSMRALDFLLDGDPADRMAAVKHVVERFVTERPADRVGLVIFGEEVFTMAPLTLDHRLLTQFLKQVNIGMAGDATAIGDALAAAANRMRSIEAKSKIVIFLTDGRRTAGEIDPLAAAEAAAVSGVRVYTIGVGREGKVPIPVEGVWGGTKIIYQESDLDEPLLKKIAETTGAQYFRAYDTESLQKIYETIDKLEKTKHHSLRFYSDHGSDLRFVTVALVLMFCELLFSLTPLRSIP